MNSAISNLSPTDRMEPMPFLGLREITGSQIHKSDPITENSPPTQQVSSNETELKLEETYLLCVDPEEKRTFKINMGTGEMLEDAKEEEYTREIKSKVER